jgi:outer membrane protein assembly factor BamB
MQLSIKNISHIDEKILLDDKIIVEINVTENDGTSWTSDECNFNIYCIDQHYNVIWQVKETRNQSSSLFEEGDPFCYLEREASGEIIANRFSGFTYIIDPETGEATCTGFRK